MTVADLKEKFQLKQVVGDEHSLNRPIEVAEISRPGFELAGFFQHSDLRRVIVFGEKEIAFIKHLSKQIQAERFDALIQSITPAIIICRGFECPAVLKSIAQKKNFPIFITNQATGRTSIEITSYLDEQLADSCSLIDGSVQDIIRIAWILYCTSTIVYEKTVFSQIAATVESLLERLVQIPAVLVISLEEEILGDRLGINHSTSE